MYKLLNQFPLLNPPNPHLLMTTDPDQPTTPQPTTTAPENPSSPSQNQTEPEAQSTLVPFEQLDPFHQLIYPWQQFYDQNTERNFYFNPFTQESVWELEKSIKEKVDLFFQRIRTEEEDRKKQNLKEHLPDLEAKTEEVNKTLQFEWMQRPARKQVETPVSANLAYKQGDEVYNIWYDKFLSDDKFKEREQAVTRINPELDQGYSRADLYNKGLGFFCIHFARGCCVEGKNCRYYHHIPTLDECLGIDQVKDVFGRSRFSKQRDDMEGVGSFLKEIRTIRLSDFCLVKSKTGDEVTPTYEALWRHAACLGKLEDIHLVPERCVAFVRYAHRCMAEFAKESLANQPLESNEIMIARWAETDILGIDPEDAETQEVKEPEFDDRIRNGRMRKKKRKTQKEVDEEKRQEMEEVFQDEAKLGRKMLAEKEFNIVEQRIEVIRENAGKMENVLKRLKVDDNANNGKNLDDEFSEFLKDYKPEVGMERGIDPRKNDLPLF